MTPAFRDKLAEIAESIANGSKVYIRLYSGDVDLTQTERNSDMDTTTTTVKTLLNPATEKQTSYIMALLLKHTGYREEFAARVTKAIADGTLPKDKASEIIDWLMAKPLRSKAAVALGETGVPGQDGTPPLAVAKSAVPEGHYAIKSITGNNDLDFFRVDRPTEGKWAGCVFVKRVVGGHPEFPVKGAARTEVLKRIEAAGVTASAVLYGTEIGRCYACNKKLTDKLSRDLGIGPKCRAGGRD